MNAKDTPNTAWSPYPHGADRFLNMSNEFAMEIARAWGVTVDPDVERKFFETRLHSHCMSVSLKYGGCIVDRDEHDGRPHRARNGFEWPWSPTRFAKPGSITDPRSPAYDTVPLDKPTRPDKPFGCSSDCRAPGCGGGCSQ